LVVLRIGDAMSKTQSSHKEEAQKALARGDLKKALEYYRNHCLLEPDDLRFSVKIGEVLERLGRKEEAVKAYRGAAEAYAQDGFLLQAISVNKMILRIDPSLQEVNDRLAQLYIEKAGETQPHQTLPPIPLFSDLNQQELQSLLSRVHASTFPKEAYICREGEAGESLLVISRGEVGIFKGNREGKEVWIHSRREGDFFGEFSFFTDRKRYASIKTLTECEILEISRKDLDEVINAHPRVKEVLYNFFTQRVLDFFLALTPLFSSLSQTERREVLRRFCLRHLPEETLLFQRGDPPTSLYMVKSGEVEISTRNPLGQKVILDIQRSGDFFGELSLLLNRPCMTDAKTTRPSELLELTKADFEACLVQFPALQSTMQGISAKRLIRIEEVFSQERVEKAKEAMV
jgi:cAMP-dependent protein kinase regulator